MLLRIRIRNVSMRFATLAIAMHQCTDYVAQRVTNSQHFPPGACLAHAWHTAGAILAHLLTPCTPLALHTAGARQRSASTRTAPARNLPGTCPAHPWHGDRASWHMLGTRRAGARHMPGPDWPTLGTHLARTLHTPGTLLAHSCARADTQVARFCSWFS